MICGGRAHLNVGHVDLDTCARFYVEVLGCKLVAYAPNVGATIDAGDGLLLTLSREKTSPATIDLCAKISLAEAMEVLRLRGVAFSESTPDAATFADPAGNVLRLVERGR